MLHPDLIPAHEPEPWRPIDAISLFLLFAAMCLLGWGAITEPLTDRRLDKPAPAANTLRHE